MEGWVAVPHSDWFDFLARQPHREEVNFWSPSDYHAFQGTPGAPFFQAEGAAERHRGVRLRGQLHASARVAGWECFGEGNGAPTLEALKERLGNVRSRSGLHVPTGPSQIGCIVVVQATFFLRDLWLRQPSDWAVRNLRPRRLDSAAAGA